MIPVWVCAALAALAVVVAAGAVAVSPYLDARLDVDL